MIDATDPDMDTKIRIVEDILTQIQATQTMLYVFNKCDELDDKKKNEIADQYYGKNLVFVSALTQE